MLLLTAVLMWAVGPIFIKYFTGYYNPWTQNAFRYTVSAAMLLAVAGARGVLRTHLTAAQWKKLLFISVTNVVMQSVFTPIYYFIYPALASLLSGLNVVFVTIMSFAIFHDERRVIRSPHFLSGAALAMVGIAVLVLGRDPEVMAHLNVSSHGFWIGVSLSVVYAFLNALYSITIKHAVTDIPAVICFTHVSWMTSLGLLVPMFIMGGVSDLWTRPVSPLLLMVFSALVSIVIAHTCFYATLKRISAAVSTSMLQLTPVLTCLFSAVLYGDTLSPVQLLGGAGVVSGAWLAGIAQAREDRLSEEAVTAPGVVK